MFLLTIIKQMMFVLLHTQVIRCFAKHGSFPICSSLLSLNLLSVTLHRKADPNSMQVIIIMKYMIASSLQQVFRPLPVNYILQ